MASDNNKINKLVPLSENDLTAELEIPKDFSEQRESDPQELEADAETCEIKQLDIQAELDEQSIGALESGPKSRTKSIDRLQSDIDQLRAEWTGLEDEISENLNAEINQLKAKLESSQRDLDERQQNLDEAQHELEQARERAEQSSAEIREIRETTKKDNSRILDLEKQLTASEKKIASIELKLQESEDRRQKDNKESVSRKQQLKKLKKELAESQAALSELRIQADERQDSWNQVEDELAQAKTSLEKSANEIEELSQVVENRDTQLERNQARLDELSQQLATQESQYEKLRSDNRELRRVTRNDTEKEIERSHKVIAEQSGLLTGRAQEISDLRAQIDRTERYADDLRQQLQEQSEIVEGAVNLKQDLQAACTSAQDKNRQLTADLADTKQQNAERTKKISALEKGFAKEVRQIRFELGAAQDTITDQDTINVQLTSDLYDNKGFQRSLETRLEELEDQYKEKIRHLEQKVNKLRNEADDFEYKLENKNQAITALMNELANRSQKAESVGEIENVVHDIGDIIDNIDDTSSQQFPEQQPSDRERVTRLLVGKTDGQEVRFPLFKDRLTIGRTANNDIQLNAQFISRRHAVIVTESGDTKIVDWGSKNGIFINEIRVAEQKLKNGDVVTIGMTDFRYEERPKR